jgi:hypothetical protein
LAALGLGIAAACGGPVVPAATETAPASGGAIVATTPGTAARPFRELAGAASASPYRVTYRVSSSAGGQAVSATQTWYVSGRNFRMDLGVASAGGSGSFSVFVIPDGTYSCVTAAGASGTQCFGMPQAQAYAQSPGAALDAEIRANPDAFGATYRDTRTIAGTSASCYGIAGTAAGFSQGTICYTSSGVPLLYQFDSSGLSFTMEATSFGVPTDADFRLPAPAQKIPGTP